jgi:hypothetical protein
LQGPKPDDGIGQGCFWSSGLPAQLQQLSFLLNWNFPSVDQPAHLIIALPSTALHQSIGITICSVFSRAVLNTFFSFPLSVPTTLAFSVLAAPVPSQLRHATAPN